MAVMTRRAFVRSGACALVALAAPPRFLVRAASAAEPGRGKVLVALFQRGAVDGLSMVVPHGDAEYYAGRPSIALARPARGRADRLIDLDGFFGLHPALAPLADAWKAGTLAAVHACGSPDATRSHFDAQDYMETGTPGVRSTPDGWLARAVAASPVAPSPFRAVAVTPTLPRALRGGAGALALTRVADFDVHAGVDTEAARRGFEALYADGGADLPHGTGREAFAALRMLRAADPGRLVPANGARYPASPLGASLEQIARLIRADVGLEVAFAEAGGWDTHAGQGNERGQFAARLADLARALAAFARDLGDRLADVVVLTMSEFGRTVRENGNGGTDHGHGTAMLVLGGPVRGGRVLGRWPGVAPEQRFEGRDLAVTTDFRALFAEVAGRHLGLPAPASLFPGFPGAPPLGVLA